ncbi:MAG TPA: AMP-binding protein [Salinarimonas sp.]|nr:AMP-binding protein [Salinarimonas sp.]
MGSGEFRAARDCLFEHGTDLQAARQAFHWPEAPRFNWALDWFDAELAQGPLRDGPAVRILGETREESTFAELSARSNQVANGLRRRGIRRGDRILLMAGNVTPLWETMLAAMKLGAVVIPTTLLLTGADLAERIARARVRCVIVPASETPKLPTLGPEIDAICIGVPPSGWTSFDLLREASAEFTPDGETQADEPLLLYFTSGTTSRPKMVLHSHRSFPVGHLATMYWLGTRPGDRHMSVGAPGWAGHTFQAFFGPWNAGATVVVLNRPRFDAGFILSALVEHRVTSFSAPPTVWRMLMQEDLAAWPVVLRGATSGGEPLNPETVEQVRRAWGVTIREGWGQTEVTTQIGTSPGEQVEPGAIGRALPGCSVAVLDEEGREVGEGEEGEFALPMTPRPVGLMLGYLQDDGSLQTVEGDYYRTGDAMRRNPDGTLTFIGRVDDVFKSANYRISPFELESVLIEHPAVAEAAVVPSPDPVRSVVPKAFVALAAGHEPSRETARSIFRHSRERLAPYKRVRRISFGDLPKTVSGKIRRAELRRMEARHDTQSGSPPEFREEEFFGQVGP